MKGGSTELDVGCRSVGDRSVVLGRAVEMSEVAGKLVCVVVPNFAPDIDSETAGFRLQGFLWDIFPGWICFNV